MAKINNVEILRQANNAIKNGAKDREIRVFLSTKAEDAAIKIGSQMQGEFEAHPVTRELSRGGEARTQVPGFPNGPRGTRYGNLAAFFGLSESKIATDLEVIKGLLSKYDIKVTKKGSAKFQISINFPTLNEFYNVTPPPSDAYPVSWLRALENGLVQNFSHFLFRLRGFKGDSRSGTGVQVKNELRKGAQSVPAIPYIKEIYEKILQDSGRAKAALGQTIRNNFKL